MAYTQNIDPATPAGSDDAKTADDQLRALKRDIIERIESIFADANIDPLTLQIPGELAVGVGSVDFYMRMALGLPFTVNIMGVDKTTAGVGRIVFGYAGGGANWAWTIFPSADPSQFPPYNSALNGLVGVDQTNGRLVFYANGSRYYISPTGTF